MLHVLKTQISKHAPILLGAAFCTLIACTSACRRGGTPEWKASQETTSSPASSPPAHPAPVSIPGEGFRFMSYNVKNWLTMERGESRSRRKAAPKPEGEKTVVISVIAKTAPDILGLCEIGTPEDLAEIQSRLRATGLDLPYSAFASGTDPQRRLGLLSRFPITATATPQQTGYELEGKILALNRGILDATVEAGGKSYRFIGVHLKSRLEVEDGPQDQMRLHEAKLIRAHLESVFRQTPDARLIVYGDFNDTRNTNTVKILTGDFNATDHLLPVPAKDAHGETWTHHWAVADVYSRIDFITVSRALKAETDFPASQVVDVPGWREGSDHRPVLARFR